MGSFAASNLATSVKLERPGGAKRVVEKGDEKPRPGEVHHIDPRQTARYLSLQIREHIQTHQDYASLRGRTGIRFVVLRNMGRPHRFVDNESGVVELTSRCVQGRFLMRPSAEVNDIILGIVGRAQRLSGVRLFAFNFQSNHSHELACVDSVEQMAIYQRFLKANLAKELGRHYEWQEKFWGRRYNSISLADDEIDQQKRLRYILANGCKDGLVDSPLDWPGVSAAWALSRGVWTLQGTWLDRTSERAAGRGPIKVRETVQLSPLPFMEHWSRERQREWFCDLLRDIEHEARERRRREGKRSVGVQRILQQDPHDRPASFQPSPAPLFHASNPVERRKLRTARELKEAAYRFAADRLRRGLPDVVFPDDCFLPPHVRAQRGPP